MQMPSTRGLCPQDTGRHASELGIYSCVKRVAATRHFHSFFFSNPYSLTSDPSLVNALNGFGF